MYKGLKMGFSEKLHGVSYCFLTNVHSIHNAGVSGSSPDIATNSLNNQQLTKPINSAFVFSENINILSEDFKGVSCF